MTDPTPLNVARPDDERAALLVWMHGTLRPEYGERPLKPRREPLHELISTILSQRTTHADEEAAYRELRTLGDWDAIIAAPVEAVAHAIRRSNYPESKAPRIQATLAALRDSPGGYDLNFLRDLPVKDALKFLTDLPGVGIKTASLVPQLQQLHTEGANGSQRDAVFIDLEHHVENVQQIRQRLV